MLNMWYDERRSAIRRVKGDSLWKWKHLFVIHNDDICPEDHILKYRLLDMYVKAHNNGQQTGVLWPLKIWQKASTWWKFWGMIDDNSCSLKALKIVRHRRTRMKLKDSTYLLEKKIYIYGLPTNCLIKTSL